MPQTRRHHLELASGGRSTVRRYRLILLHEGRKSVDFEAERELGLGDHVDLEGRPLEVVGLVWKRGELLCAPIGPPLRHN